MKYLSGLDAGGFHVKGWVSNAVLNDEEQQGEVVLGQDPLNDTQKVLGTVWNPQQDKFSFKVKLGHTDVLESDETLCSTVPGKLTKRIILSKISGIFDPIGDLEVVPLF
jgi:hypothetical protein